MYPTTNLAAEAKSIYVVLLSPFDVGRPPLNLLSTWLEFGWRFPQSYLV